MTLAAAEQIDVPAMNAAFEATDPQKIVSWSATTFAPELVMTSSFGAESAALLHMATQVVPDIKIIMIDTGYLFPETHAFMEDLRQRLNLNVWIYRTRNDPIAYLRKAGEENPQFRKDVDACCAANKNEPMDRAMKQLQPRAWMRGIRRDQSESRLGTPFVEWSARYKCFAISPLLNWRSRDVYTYLKKHDLPYHPLFEKGYASIGCYPCTRPIQIGEDSRSGRWSGTNKVECGINLINSLDSANL
jgi:phosphoadenosine phosphosulfate reductase